jgi:putative acetyltransferase
VLIRRELLTDVDAIDEVHRQAFAAGTDVEPLEVGLVHTLRADPGWIPALSLVAEDPAGDVVGHVVCTEGAVAGVAVVGLGPIGVLPARQRAGVGRALMHAVLAAADAMDYPLVALLGHMDYYPQFGFRPARALGIVAPDPNWGDHFQVRPLAGWHQGLRGTFRYAAPFEAL